MKKAFLILGLTLFSVSAGAYNETYLRHIKVPHTVAPPIPYFLVERPRQKIYTPDRYSCYMRQKHKYCVDDKGRALNGQIVISSTHQVAYESYMNGYQNGETSVFSLSGVLLERTYYKKGVKHGESIIYYANGNVRLLAKYKDGALNGHVEEYDENGALLGQMTYKNGWFREGNCRNEKGGHTMHERQTKGKYNEIIPCGTVLEQ